MTARNLEYEGLKEIADSIRNNFESLCSAKIETNSKGFNTTVHVYQNATKEQIDDTMAKAFYAHTVLQKLLLPEEVEAKK